jgi:hypothetical protein
MQPKKKKKNRRIASIHLMKASDHAFDGVGDYSRILCVCVNAPVVVYRLIYMDGRWGMNDSCVSLGERREPG